MCNHAGRKDENVFSFYFQQIEVTENKVQLMKLEAEKLYKVFVVSKNAHGTSLPSSILLLNITETGKRLLLDMKNTKFSNSLD